jgi:hypothetical protein
MGSTQSTKIKRHQASLAVSVPVDAFDDPPNAIVFFSRPFLLRLEGQQIGKGFMRRFMFRPPEEFLYLSAKDSTREVCVETIPTQSSLMTCHRPGADRVNVRKQINKVAIGHNETITLYGNTAHGKYLHRVQPTITTSNQQQPSLVQKLLGKSISSSSHDTSSRFYFNASPSKVRKDHTLCSEFILKPALRKQATNELRFGDLVSFKDKSSGMYLYITQCGHMILSSSLRSLFSVQNPTLLQLVKIRDMAAAAATAEATTGGSSSITTNMSLEEQLIHQRNNNNQHRTSTDNNTIINELDEDDEDVFLPLVEDPVNTSLWNNMAELPMEVVVRILSYRRNFLGTARLLSKSWKYAAELLIRAIRVNGDFAMFHIPQERVSLVSLVARCTNLEKLRLKNIIELSDEEIKEMSLCTHARLKHVEVGGCTGLTDKTTIEIAQIPHLEYLNLAATGISDESLAIVGCLQHVEVVNLYGCRVTARGIDMCALKTEHSDGLLHLEHLNLRGTVVGKEDVVNLTQRRPSIEVLTGPPKLETVFG